MFAIVCPALQVIEDWLSRQLVPFKVEDLKSNTCSSLDENKDCDGLN